MTHQQWRYMKPLDWEMEPGTYEDLVSCLLSNLNPSVLRIDGSGGDEGRDVQYRLADGLHIYELKSFTGRMNKGRRAQVEKSLSNAAKLSPAGWEMVVPVDPNPAELRWFGNLQHDYSFPLVWRGKTWLDARMIERRYIWRHYREDANAEVVEILKELGHEGAALERGIPDVIERAKSLVARANDLDPHYTFRVETDGTKTKVSILPRYVGATEDRPITTHVEFRFDTNTPEGKTKFEEFKLAYDFGVPLDLSAEFISMAQVDAPAGLGGVFAPSHLSMGPGHSDGARPLDFELVALSEAGETLERLPITMVPQTVGKKGAIMVGHDRSGLLDVRLILAHEPVPQSFELHLRSGSFVPHELLGAARLMAVLHEPNALWVRTKDLVFSAYGVPGRTSDRSTLRPVRG